MNRLCTVVAIAVLAGCATRTEYVTTALPLPARPELPSIEGAGLMCLSAATYRALVTRDRRLREYAEQLAAVIRSTHEEDE